MALLALVIVTGGGVLETVLMGHPPMGVEFLLGQQNMERVEAAPLVVMLAQELHLVRHLVETVQTVIWSRNGRSEKMPNFAIIENGKVVNKAVSSVPLGANWKLCDGTPAHIGGDYDEINNAFSAPPVPTQLPTLKITAIAADATHAAGTVIAADFGEVTCPAGTTLTVSAKLVDADGATIPLTGSFRMPLIASDGRERIVGVGMTAGVASIDVPLAESGVWSVTAANLNRDLPAAQHMAFPGIKVYVTL